MNPNTCVKTPAHLPRHLGDLVVALILIGGICLTASSQAAEHRRPVVQEPWIQIAGDPDLGELTTEKQQPVDFGIWQAADGMWQLWSCIRSTKEPGRTRLFYRWEGVKLTDANWKPMGIAMHPDPKFGELAGGLQAPYVLRTEGHFELYYGGWEDICSATSTDGKTFQRRLNADGKATLFRSPDGYAQTRDPMVLRIGDFWHCYYTAHTGKKGADFCRTSKDLRTWSEARMVAAGGQSGSDNFSAECPFVVELESGQYYLFRTQHYGTNQQTSVYFSRDPMDFGVDHDEGHFVCTLPVAAPEIIKHEGRYFIAALLPSLKGIQISQLTWE
jgi:hypothetical protein